MARLLLDRGADIEGQNNLGWTPLCQACSAGHEVVAKLLLDRGAEIESESDAMNPLTIACIKGHVAVARLLLQHGAHSIPEDDSFEPAGNAVLQQWRDMSQARKEVVARYGWEYADLPEAWVVGQHAQYPVDFRRYVAAAALAWRAPLAPFNKGPGDTVQQLAGALHVIMGFKP